MGIMEKIVLLIFGLNTVAGVTVTQDEKFCAPGSNMMMMMTTQPPGKQYNETCTSSSECWRGYGPTACTGGVCRCAPNYTPSRYTYITYPNQTVSYVYCNIAPGLNSICTDECAWPYKCVESVTTYPSTTESPYYYYITTPRSTGPTKRCQCVAPFRINEYGYCILQCQPDEVPMGNDACHKRCSENEIQTANFECKPIAALDAACDVDEQCSAPFSECSEKKCTCRKYFTQDAGSCVVAAARCEFGDPLRPPGSTNGAVRCQISNVYMGARINVDAGIAAPVVQMSSATTYAPPTQPAKDGCPNDEYYCQPIDSPRGYTSEGICCPFSKPYCPVGEPHPNANCTSSSTDSMYNTPSPYAIVNRGDAPPGECPPETHYCYRRQNDMSMGTCCPRACPRQMVLVDKQCVPLAPMGGKCKMNEQCNSMNAECINGICACPPKTREIKSSVGLAYCEATCIYLTETVINSRCTPRLKIGDQCRGQESRCPPSSYCNSAGVCQCSCSTMAINGIICAQAPTCPSIRPTTPNYNYYYTTQLPTKEAFEKATFCKDPSYPDLVPDAVEVCPGNQYCRSYVSGLGVCCEKPEPFCPNNDKIYEKCSITSYTGSTPGYYPTTGNPNCKTGQFCNIYAPGAIGNYTDIGVCCDNYVYVPTTRPPIIYTTTIHPIVAIFSYNTTNNNNNNYVYTSPNPNFRPFPETSPRPYQPTNPPTPFPPAPAPPAPHL